MASLKVAFGTATAFDGGALDSLANGSVGTSAEVDNSANLYQDYLIEVYVDGTAAATAYLEVRAVPCIDGTNYGLWQSAIPLGIIDLSVDLQRAVFSLCGHGGFFSAPQKFKIMVKNSTGAALHATACNMTHQGVYTTSA